MIAATYGWALEQAGHDVEFYVRPGRAATYGPTIDLDILDTRQRIWGRRVVRTWPVRYRETLEPDHDFDLIVLSLPHRRLHEAADFIAARVGNATVLVFGNIWSEPRAAIGALPLDRVAWGFPGAAGSFRDVGQLYGILLRSVFFGTLDRPPNEREQAVRTVFRDAGFRISEQPDFRGWLWLHFVLDTAVHSQALRAGSLAKLAGNAKGLRDAMLTARELLPLVETRGIDLRRHRREVTMARAPAGLTGSVLAWASKHFPPARRSFEALSDPEAAEPRSICRDTLAEARRMGVAVPRLEDAEPLFRQEEN